MTPLLQLATSARAVGIDELSAGGDVVVLAPHPDDESLGCGAAIAALSDRGRKVQVVVITDGCMSHPASRAYPADRLRRLRADEVRNAVAILTRGRGPAPILLDYPDTASPHAEDAVAAALARIRPILGDATTAIWSTWGGDPHVDHGRTARIAERLAAERPALALWSYPIWGRFAVDVRILDRAPPARFDSLPWQAGKAAAVAAHASQMTGLISDDPACFRMSLAQQRHFITTPELFFREG